MKLKIHFIILFSLFSSFLFGQKTKLQTTYYTRELKESEGKVDKNKKKTGQWKFWDAEGNLVLMAEFENDLLHGEYIMEKMIWNIGNSTSSSEKFYKKALARQKVSQLDTIIERCMYVNGNAEGIRKIYDPSNGNIVSEMEYVNGEKHGEVRMYDYNNGKISEKHFYFRGVTDSAYFFDANELLYQKSFLVPGGKKNNYYRDGKLYLQSFDLTEGDIHKKINCAWKDDQMIKCDTVTKDYSKEKLNSEEIFVVVETQPEFPGGLEDLYRFIINNIEIDSSLVRRPIKGRVYLSFVVRKDGNVVDPKIIRGLEPEVDRAVLALASKMPKWIPGRQRGNEVHVQYHLPILINIEE